MKLSEFYPASQAYDQALEELDGAVKEGTVTTPQQIKDFLDKRIKQLLEEMVKKLMEASHRSQIIGIVEGAILSFLGGMFASSYFNWLNTNPQTSLTLAVICGLGFCVALGLVIRDLKKRISQKKPTG